MIWLFFRGFCGQFSILYRLDEHSQAVNRIDEINIFNFPL